MPRKDAIHEIVTNYKEVSASLGRSAGEAEYSVSPLSKFSIPYIKSVFKSWHALMRAAGNTPKTEEKEPPFPDGPKILIFDIETMYMLVKVWSLGDQVVRSDQIARDWSVACWSAKWYGKPEMFSMDNRNAERIEDDKSVCMGLWKMLDEAHVVITKNGKRFDQKKMMWRFMFHDIGAPSPFLHIDTEQMIRQSAAPSSSKLEFLAEALDLEHKKSEHGKFPGRKLWDECEAGNHDAWNEMVEYNKRDVLSTEALYDRIQPYCKTPGVNLGVFRPGNNFACPRCGSAEVIKRGKQATSTAAYSQYSCNNCRHWFLDRSVNLLSPMKRQSLKGPL